MNFLFAILYAIGIRIYWLGILISSAWNRKAKQWLTGRKKLFARITDSLRPNEHRAWFHCASAGEFEQGRPVIEAYRKKFPTHKIVLTFYSPSGYELRKNYPGADYVFYLPLDTKANAAKFISLVNPKLVVIVKYEFWFHFFAEINNRKIPAVMISALFRENHFLFNPLASPLKRELQSFKKVFVQDEASFLRLQQNGFTNAELAGDTRFDRVSEIAANPKQLSVIENFKGEKKLLVAGSTWKADEDLLLQLVTAIPAEWKLVIVPHEIDDAHLVKLKEASPRSMIFYSEVETGKNFSDEKILVVDKIGLLSSVYQYAAVAYIGGGFGKGIHNTLEPAVNGIPVLFGPNYQKFNEAKALIKIGGAKSVTNFAELKTAFEFFQQEKNLQLGKANSTWVKKNTGAAGIILKALSVIS